MPHHSEELPVRISSPSTKKLPSRLRWFPSTKSFGWGRRVTMGAGRKARERGRGYAEIWSSRLFTAPGTRRGNGPRSDQPAAVGFGGQGKVPPHPQQRRIRPSSRRSVSSSSSRSRSMKLPSRARKSLVARQRGQRTSRIMPSGAASRATTGGEAGAGRTGVRRKIRHLLQTPTRRRRGWRLGAAARPVHSLVRDALGSIIGATFITLHHSGDSRVRTSTSSIKKLLLARAARSAWPSRLGRERPGRHVMVGALPPTVPSMNGMTRRFFLHREVAPLTRPAVHAAWATGRFRRSR